MLKRNQKTLLYISWCVFYKAIQIQAFPGVQAPFLGPKPGIKCGKITNFSKINT